MQHAGVRKADVRRKNGIARQKRRLIRALTQAKTNLLAAVVVQAQQLRVAWIHFSQHVHGPSMHPHQCLHGMPDLLQQRQRLFVMRLAHDHVLGYDAARRALIDRCPRPPSAAANGHPRGSWGEEHASAEVSTPRVTASFATRGLQRSRPYATTPTKKGRAYSHFEAAENGRRIGRRLGLVAVVCARVR